MSTFIEIILGFPTVLFTGPLVLASFYWLLAMVGAVDLEIFDGLDGAVDGLADAAVEGVADAAADAVADAAADALADGAAEVADGTSAGVAGPLVYLLDVLRVGKVPVTVSLTLFILWGWVTGFLLTWLYRNVFGLGVIPHTAFAIASLLFAVVVGLALTNVSVRPLEPVFKMAHGRGRGSLLGETAELTTGRVDPNFGQATLQVQGDDLVIQVRCDRPGNGLGRGDSVLIVSYDQRREAFIVEPLSAVKVVSTASTNPVAGGMPLPTARESEAPP